MLQDQAGLVMGGQLCRELRHHTAGLMRADGTQDGAGGKVTISALNHVGTDDVDRHGRIAQDFLSHGTDQQFADGAGRMSAHDDVINLPLAQEGEDLFGGLPMANHGCAMDAEIFGALDKRLKTLLQVTDKGVVVRRDRGGLLRGNVNTVINMKDNEIRAELGGLCQGKGKSLLVGGKLRGEEDGGGLAPPWLDGGHRKLLSWIFCGKAPDSTSKSKSGQ